MSHASKYEGTSTANLSKHEYLRFELTTSSLSYLHTITGGAPLALEANPHGWLSPAMSPLPLDDEDRVLFSSPDSIQLALEVAGGQYLYNENTSLSEYVVLFKPDDLFGQAYSFARDFRPYFTWIIQPSNSFRCRNFMVAMVNAMVNDVISLPGTVRLASDASNFNPATQGDLSNLY